VLNTTTVTMPILEKLDGLDTGLYPISASEFRTKLKSRQSLWQSAGVPDAQAAYNMTDRYNTSICRSINEAAYEWALATASSTARARFHKHGTPLRMVADTWSRIGITGPTWIHNKLTFTPAKDESGASVVDVAAPYFSVENKNLGDVPYIETVGYHYCKLLSPARAMEWIYVDGLHATAAAPRTTD